MKYIYYAVIVSSILCFTTSCEQDANQVENQDFIITAGIVCGWCMGNDSIQIKAKSFCYSKYNPCEGKESDRNIDTCGQLEDIIWNELMTSIDFEVFKSIDINTCNVCVDGCDNWIRIETPYDSHYIRFGFDDPEILAPISDFIDKVEEVLGTHRSNYQE